MQRVYLEGMGGRGFPCLNKIAFNINPPPQKKGRQGFGPERKDGVPVTEGGSGCWGR